jgi:hypothetical protein
MRTEEVGVLLRTSDPLIEHFLTDRSRPDRIGARPVAPSRRNIAAS